MQTEITGSDHEQGIGVNVFDEQNNRHWMAVTWDGTIREHQQESYPHEPEDRTQEEQRIMSEVEARAKYAAQQEFPEEDILDPMWDPEHLDRGVEAVMNYPLEDFHAEFRDFYEGLREPTQFISDDRYVSEGGLVYKPIRVTDQNRIAEVGDVALRYRIDSGETEQVGTVVQYPLDELVYCCMPPLEFESHMSFKEDFHEVVTGHLMAQIRDLYLHMGEEPPDEYKVDGIGKMDIHGDGFGDS
jgi:hypothetical protein